MHDCCSLNGNAIPPKKSRCPVSAVECSIECSGVSLQTIMHHIKNPWLWAEKKQGYYFCEDPACDVIYFGEDGSVIGKLDVRGEVGIKSQSPDALICYCFGVSRAEALSNSVSREYVIGKTKNGLCSCNTSNPSGRCCLKDFPRTEMR